MDNISNRNESLSVSNFVLIDVRADDTEPIASASPMQHSLPLSLNRVCPLMDNLRIMFESLRYCQAKDNGKIFPFLRVSITTDLSFFSGCIALESR